MNKRVEGVKERGVTATMSCEGMERSDREVGVRMATRG